MKQIVSLVLALTLLLLPIAPARAWSGAGHMVIAAGAYRELSPETQKKVTEILKSHPDYKRWMAAYQPGSVDLSLYVFMKASTWPDEIRRKGNEYNHPHWHYVDYPLKPPGFPIEPGPAPTDDLLYGIAQSEKALKDASSSPELKAVYLSYLIHLIGDMHQPLHCSSLVNATYPKGDKGGNDFYVKPNTRGIKLHSLWDGLLGTSGTPQAHMNKATEIRSEHPKKALSELTKDTTPEKWSLESRALAIEKGYLKGQLKGSNSADSAPALPEDYTRSAKSVAEKQAALAGYRLADEIKRFGL